MILMHGINSLKVGLGKVVRIGWNDYPVIKVGNLLWIAENFKEDVGSGVWYNNDPKYESMKFGRLYPVSGYNGIREILPEGWRIANRSDWQDILSYYTRSELSSDYWECGPQPNTIGFNATGCGMYFDAFKSIYIRCVFGYGDSNYLNQSFQASNDEVSGWEGNDSSTWSRQKFTIRIVKDAT